MAGQQAVDMNFEIKSKLLEATMDTSLSLPKRKKLKRLKHKGNLSTIHSASLNRSRRSNLSFNSTFVKQTLRSNNRNLARTLESVRKDLKICQQEKLEAMRESHELREQVRTLQRVCGLKNDEIEQEVNRRIAERMTEVKNVILKASQGLQNTVPLLMQGLVLCSGSGRSSSVGSYLSTGESGTRSSTDSRVSSPIEQTEAKAKVSNVTRRSIFGTPAVITDSSEEFPKAVGPVRSALPASQPTPSTSCDTEDTAPAAAVRPSDFCHSDLSMIMEQSHLNLNDLDLDDIDGISTTRRSSRQRLSRKTKSRGRRSTVHASRSLELFQQSLVENSSQEESQSTETAPTPEDSQKKNNTRQKRSSGPKERKTEEDPETAAGVNMETDAQIDTDMPQTYECKLNDVEDNEDAQGDAKIKAHRTRSRSMKRTKSSGRETRSKSRSRKRSASLGTDKEDEKTEKTSSERPSRSSSRMSRRDSYEQTLIQKSAEKRKSSRSMSRKSKRMTGKDGDIEGREEQTGKEDESHMEESAAEKLMSRRKSSRGKTEVRQDSAESESANGPQDGDKIYENETSCKTETSKKEGDSEKGIGQSEERVTRRKSRRTIGKRKSETDEKESSSNIGTTDLPEQDEDIPKERTTRKSKRFQVEISMKAGGEDDDKPKSNVEITKTAVSLPQSEIEKKVDAEDNTAEVIQKDSRMRRKSARVTSKNRAEDSDSSAKDTGSASSKSADAEKSTETLVADENFPSNTSNRTEKDRRGTFVVNKEPVVAITVDKKIEKLAEEKKQNNRRGTFVVPTAPPPAAKSKKTVSNIPTLAAKSKPAEEKETKKKPDRDRRGTYFVAKPVTPYLDVENIEDIEADSLLISLTDDESQNSVFMPPETEKEADKSAEKAEKKSQLQQENSFKPPVGPREPSPALQVGETTVLEPQDMELTEALPVINWSRFSAPEPDFLKKISPGPATRPVKVQEAVAKDNSQENAAENKKDNTKNKSEVHVSESDMEDEQQTKREKRKSTMIASKAKPADTIGENKIVSETPDTDDKTTPVDKGVLPDKTNTEMTGKQEAKAVKGHHERSRSKKFKLLKAKDDTLGPSDTESVTSEVAASENEDQDSKRVGEGRRSRRSTKPVKYAEVSSDEEEEKNEETKEKLSDLLKAKSKQKYQAWLSKPGDIKFTGGKRDISTQLVEDLTKHHRSKSKDRSTIIPKPRGRSRSRSRSRPRIPIPDNDSPKNEYDFAGTPPQDRLKQLDKSSSKDGHPKSPSRMSYSEFRGRTPARKSMVQESNGEREPVVVPLEPKKTNCPEEDEFTVHDHGIMLLLGNGRRTKPRTKGKSVCMAPEKSNVHLITPMVGKTQSMPRTPPPHGDATVDETPPDNLIRNSPPPKVALKSPPPNIVLKSTPPPMKSGATAATKPSHEFQKPILVPPPKPKVINPEPVISIPESPLVSPQRTSSSNTCCIDVTRRSRTKSSDKYFGFEIDDDDSVFQTESPPPVNPQIKKHNGLPRKSLMEAKPKTESLSSQTDSSSSDSAISKTKLSKSVKKKNRIESETDDVSSPQVPSPIKSKRRERGNRSRSRVRQPSADKENEMSSDSSPHRVSHRTTSKTPAAKTPAVPKSAKSAKGKSTKKATKTPGTTKKGARVTLTNLKRKLEIIRSKTGSEDESKSKEGTDHSPDPKTKRSKANRRLYDDTDIDTAIKLQKRKSGEMEPPAGFVVFEDATSPKRPRRAAAKVACYVEPSIGSKLRQGDPGTSTIYSADDMKSFARRSKGSSRKRDALHTVTNIKV